jgi:hypothetical protein
MGEIAPASAQPGVRWMFHATAMGPSYDAMFEPLERLFGCRVLHFQANDAPAVERRGGMVWIADNSIELGEPLGESAAIRGFVERFGGGMHSVAVQVADLDAALERAAGLGVEVGARVSDEIVFTRPAGTAGLLLEWAAHVQVDDPRWGAPEPPFTRPPVVVPERVAFVGALTADPAAAAAHLAGVLDTSATVHDATGALDTPHASVALGDCVLALYPVPDAASSEAIWGAVHERPRCLALGLTVADLAVAEHALAGAGVTVHHRIADGSLVLPPSVCTFPIVLTEHLLDGDPRR